LYSLHPDFKLLSGADLLLGAERRYCKSSLGIVGVFHST